MLPGTHSTRLAATLLGLASQYVSRRVRGPDASPTSTHYLAKRASEAHGPEFIVFACLIPVLVILSGIFAGLTLGYMSLDETQLHVLSISGTPKQREYANKIKPIRSNGHLLLVTLLLANMIVNETLPVISDPILGGGVQSVVVSTVLIVIFSEILPQSICTRHGLLIGAKMAGLTQILIYMLGIVAWPVAKLLEWVLGPHHGIIYRRAELKELIAMHSQISPHGGDLKMDTVTIIGATLDLQEKVAHQAMTPIEDVFMLSINDRLDYATLRRICETGHSRIPIYDEVPVPVRAALTIIGPADFDNLQIKDGEERVKVKKIIGILLVKQCVLLDPQDATPIRKLPLNRVPTVPRNFPLLGILDRFQEGRSHMAIVTRADIVKAASVKKAAKRGLTQKLMQSVGIGDSSSSDDSDEEDDAESGSGTNGSTKLGEGERSVIEGDGEGSGEEGRKEKNKNKKERKKNSKKKNKGEDIEMGKVEAEKERHKLFKNEQSMPADAVLGKEEAKAFLKPTDADLMPIGIITLEDVLEELIGEEIYDEFDQEGNLADSSYIPPEKPSLRRKLSAPEMTIAPSQAPTATTVTTTGSVAQGTTSVSPRKGSPAQRAGVPLPSLPLPALRNLNFLRSRSAPPTPREVNAPLPAPAMPTVDGSPPAAEPENRLGDTPPLTRAQPMVVEPGAVQTTSTPSVSSPLANSVTAATLASPSEGDDKGIVFTQSPETAYQMPPSILIDSSATATDTKNLSASGSGTVTPSKPSGVTLPPVPQRTPSGTSMIMLPGGTPAPLEAILRDRKRRQRVGVAGSSGDSTPTAASASSLPGAASGMAKAASTAPKGMMFKSSPLGGGATASRSRTTQRKGSLDAPRPDTVAGEGRSTPQRSGSLDTRLSIPDQQDKAGPDKDV